MCINFYLKKEDRTHFISKLSLMWNESIAKMMILHLGIDIFQRNQRRSTWSFQDFTHISIFDMFLPPYPIQCHFMWKTCTWNVAQKFMMFHINLHPPCPIQCQIARNFSFLEGGGAICARGFVTMTLIGAWGNAWKKYCPPLWGLETKF